VHVVQHEQRRRLAKEILDAPKQPPTRERRLVTERVSDLRSGVE
jgi:hypothetical protein